MELQGLWREEVGAQWPVKMKTNPASWDSIIYESLYGHDIHSIQAHATATISSNGLLETGSGVDWASIYVYSLSVLHALVSNKEGLNRRQRGFEPRTPSCLRKGIWVVLLLDRAARSD